LNGDPYQSIEDADSYLSLKQLRHRFNFKFEYFFIDQDLNEISLQNEEFISPIDIIGQGNKIRLMQKAIKVPLKYKNLTEYINMVKTIMSNEELIEQSRERQVMEANFTFDKSEQRLITKRLKMILDKSDNIKEKVYL
jgi:hypothetical protein